MVSTGLSSCLLGDAQARCSHSPLRRRCRHVGASPISLRRLAFAALCLLLYSEAASGEAGEELPSLLWMAPILAGGGYSSEAMSYALELDKIYRQSGKTQFGLRQFAEHENMEFIRGLPDEILQTMQHLMQNGRRPQRSGWQVVICHATPDVWHADGAFGWGRVNPCPPRDARYRVGRTMYETDRLPHAWVERINALHEVWVPSKFAVEQFVSSGVHQEKVFVVPEAVDTKLFDPALHLPLELGEGSRTGTGQSRKSASTQSARSVFRFLSVFKWEKRKGWEVLLQAYFEEFTAEDAVELIIKTNAFHSDSNFEDQIAAFAATLPQARKPLAHHSVLTTSLSLQQLPRLYRAADAFVLPSRGEGWGRPHVEAMSMGLPVIATNWSGSTEFLSTHCALPLGIEGLSAAEGAPPGHLWADPSVSHLRSLMRWAFENPSKAKALGARAREEMVTRFSPQVVAREHVLPQLHRIAFALREGRVAKSASSEL